MPYLSYPSPPMDSRQPSPFSDSSSTGHQRSPSTEATSVSWTHSPSNGLHKRKADRLLCLPRKQARLSQSGMNQDPTGQTTPSARGEELLQDSSLEALDSQASSGARTKVPLDSCAGLPAQIWRRVLTYLPPKSLGQLLSVNQAFNSFLGGTIANSSAGSTSGSAQRSDSEEIWTKSRKLYHHHLPRPLSTHTELSMWKLIGGRRCQYCTRETGSKNGHTFSPARGPRGQGIRVYWSLGIRCCYKCLRSETVTVCEILQYS